MKHQPILFYMQPLLGRFLEGMAPTGKGEALLSRSINKRRNTNQLVSLPSYHHQLDGVPCQ